MTDDERRAERDEFLRRIDETRADLARRCVECERRWDDERERWRMFLDDDDVPHLYCPNCAVLEFD